MPRSRWLAGLLALAIVSVVTIYVVAGGSTDEGDEEPRRSEEHDWVESPSAQSASVAFDEHEPRENVRTAARVAGDAGAGGPPIRAGEPRGASVGALAPVGAPEAPRPSRSARSGPVSPQLALRRARVIAEALEERIGQLREQREQAEAEGNTARIQRIDRFLERLEGERPNVDTRIRELEREAAAAPDEEG
jgi:hypothetical protein